MTQDITVSNLGPIDKFTFKLDGYGVTVLTAANGSGKSILLNAVQNGMLGKGKLPLRDGERRGSVELPGAVISIGQTTRYNGECEIVNLESRMPLAALVDPQMKSPEAADRHRIKALVALTGVVASRDMFANHDALKADFDQIVTEDACRTDDLVDMAARVKRDYEAKAREAEKDADREEGHARGMEEAASGIDLTAESDANQLQAEYDAARDAHTKLVAELDQREKRSAAAVAAKQDLAALLANYQGKSLADATARYQADVELMDRQQKRVAMLREELAAAETLLGNCINAADKARLERQRAEEHENSVQALEQAIAGFTVGDQAVDSGDPAATQAAVERAKTAMELGVKIRDAKFKLDRAEAHKEAAALARKKAEHLRSAAGCVDEVLSDAIQCDVLQVDIQDGAARLVVNHPQRGEKTPYHELSMGERWRIAIGIGADRVGEGGLLAVEQDAWESLDAFVRPLIHQHAIERKVHVLTAEATRDTEDGREMQAKPFAEAVAT